jgi:hypothetical protein
MKFENPRHIKQITIGSMDILLFRFSEWKIINKLDMLIFHIGYISVYIQKKKKINPMKV